jgi:hypothetical protein
MEIFVFNFYVLNSSLLHLSSLKFKFYSPLIKYSGFGVYSMNKTGGRMEMSYSIGKMQHVDLAPSHSLHMPFFGANFLYDYGFRNVATFALPVKQSNHSTRSHP